MQTDSQKKPVTIITKTLFSVGAKIWNSIPENLRKLLKRSFKKQIHNLLLLDLIYLFIYLFIIFPQ